jgi:hypothetical protein
MTAYGTSRHFAAAQQFSCVRSEADIQASRAYRTGFMTTGPVPDLFLGAKHLFFAAKVRRTAQSAPLNAGTSSARTPSTSDQAAKAGRQFIERTGAADKKIAALERQLNANERTVEQSARRTEHHEFQSGGTAARAAAGHRVKFEIADGQFTMPDMHSDAAAAWRRFVADMVEANDGIMTPNDPAGQVVALPVRRSGNAA